MWCKFLFQLGFRSTYAFNIFYKKKGKRKKHAFKEKLHWKCNCRSAVQLVPAGVAGLLIWVLIWRPPIIGFLDSIYKDKRLFSFNVLAGITMYSFLAKKKKTMKFENVWVGAKVKLLILETIGNHKTIPILGLIWVPKDVPCPSSIS